jgi:hypothetical protein
LNPESGIRNAEFNRARVLHFEFRIPDSVFYDRPSRNARSFRLRDGCRSLRSALASI